MKVYPLIYSRTKREDYISGFLVRPQDIDHDMASKYVGQALEEVKHAGGIRHAVFSVGKYIVYGGTACISQVLVSRILEEKGISELDYEYKDYQNDKANRPITFFIGFGVKRDSIFRSEDIPQIDLYTTYKIYLDYLKKQWLALTAKTQIIDGNEGIEVDAIQYSETFMPTTVEFDGKYFVKNYDERKYQQVINYYFHQMLCDERKDFSFLSNVLPDTITSCTHFKYISIYGISPELYIEKYKPITNKSSINYIPPVDKANSSPTIYRAGNMYLHDTPGKTDTVKPSMTNEPVIYHNSAEFARTQKDKEPKKKYHFPCSMTSRIILVLIMALILGIILIAITRVGSSIK